MFEIGNSLRESRLRQQRDFAELEHATKVRAKYLRALEDEQFDVLPAQTYVRGFLRSYADQLGLDGQLYVDEYNSRFATGEDAVPPRTRRSEVRPPRRHRRVERNVVILALVVIAAITALVIAAWRFGGGTDTTVPNPSKGAAVAAKQTRAPLAPPRNPNLARLVVRAAGGNSLLQVRVGSATGKPLYQGTIERGQAVAFTSRRLWLNIGAPENLSMKLNRRPIAVGGSAPRVLIITAKQIRAAAPGT